MSAPRSLSRVKHHCPGNLYYVAEDCTLHAHHSNILRQSEKRKPEDKNCPDCYKIKVIYPKNVSTRARNELSRSPNDSANKADSVSIYAHLKKNRRAEYTASDAGSKEKNNFTLRSYFKWRFLFNIVIFRCNKVYRLFQALYVVSLLVDSSRLRISSCSSYQHHRCALWVHNAHIQVSASALLYYILCKHQFTKILGQT